MESMSLSPGSRFSSPSTSMSVSPSLPTVSLPDLSLDDIIASNRRTAAAARHTHHANKPKKHRSRKTPYLRRTPASSPPPRSPSLRPNGSPSYRGSPSRPHGSPGNNGNRRRYHPYSRPKNPTGSRESPVLHAWEGRRLHVSNLAPAVTDELLQKLLSKAGKIIECSIHYDADGESKGSAFVEFANERGATKALATLQGASFYGMPIVLDVLVQ